MLFSFVFGFVDNLHHMVEHWETEGHIQANNQSLVSTESNSTLAAKGNKLHSIHDEPSHILEMN